MKNTIGFLTILTLSHFCQLSLAQSPQFFKYQSVARNASGRPIENSHIGVRITIHDLTETGTIVFRETHAVTTNSFGLFTISVGGGTVVTGNISAIAWGAGAKFMEVEADFSGGTSYTSMGASQLLSVPYALHAQNGPPGLQGPQGIPGPQGPNGVQGLAGPTGSAGPTGATGSIGPAGATGPIGATGASGATGPQGPAGSNGSNGLNVLSGTINPAAGIGVNGELYINVTNSTLFGPKSGGVWPAGVPLVGLTGAIGPQGPAGATGVSGTAGANGLNMLSGTINPAAGTGINGEFYINTTSKTLFGPKVGGVWPTGVSLIGPTGATGTTGLQGPAGATGANGAVGATGLQGPTGVAGANGAAGTNGLNVLSGAGNPLAGTGVNGEFYINTTSNTLFGPKAGGAWPAGISLIGPIGTTGVAGAAGATGPQGPTGVAGANGATGTNGLNVLSGISNPVAGTGVNGEFYINTTSNTLFGPKASGAWPAGVSLVGPSGATGATGLQGPVGATGATGAVGATGPQGPTGVAGANGAAGTNGLNVLSGAGNPIAGTGVNGEFYINTTSNTLFGPKAAGAWPAGVSLVGPTGTTGVTGTAGTNGLNVLSGDSNPVAGTGVNGEFYINTTSNTLFGPKAAGAWPAGVSLVGTTGPQGPTGPTGLLTAGSAAGNTPYWNGTSWVTNNSNIFNSGANVGVGTATPGAKLEVAGAIKITDGTQGAGKVLTSNASGLASWQVIPGGGNMVSTNNLSDVASVPAARANLGLGSLATLSSVGTLEIIDGSVSSADILDATIANADVNPAAAISGTKVTPAFGSQNISTSGSATLGAGVLAGSTNQFSINGTGNITKLNNIATSFPGAQGAANTLLTNDGSGNLSWAVPPSPFSTNLFIPRGNGTSMVSSTVQDDGTNTSIGTALNSQNRLTVSTASNDNAFRASNIRSGSAVNAGINSLASGSTTQNKGLVASATGGTGNYAIESSATGAQGSYNYGLYSNVSTASGTADENFGAELRAVGASITNRGIRAYASGGFANYGGVFAADGGTIAIGAWFVANGGTTNWAGIFEEGNVGITNGLAFGPSRNFGTVGQVLTSSGPGVTPVWTTAGLPTLNSGNIYVGSVSNVPSSVVMTGDASINNIGNITITPNAIGSSEITDLSVVDADISATASISGTKVNPNFAAQNIVTTGTITSGSGLNAGGTNQFTINNSGNITKVNNLAISFPAVQGGAGTVLTNNGTGTLTWASSSGGWGLTGTSGTVDGTNFIGTTDNIPLNFRVNNQKAGKIDHLLLNTFVGYLAGNSNPTGVNNTGFGHQALSFNTTGTANVALGYRSLYQNTTGISNTATGAEALEFNTTGNYNTANGLFSLYTNTSGSNNTANGYTSLYSNTIGNFNTATGINSLRSNTSGNENTAVGVAALRNNTTGIDNTALGVSALLTNTTGNFNTSLGYQADVTTSGLSKAVAIGYNAKVSANNSLVLGGTGVDAVKVGIGVMAPATTLDILGNIKIVDGTQGVGKILTSDAAGVGTWSTVAGLGWGLTGTAGTVDGTNFMGTTDNIPLSFKINNQRAGRIDHLLNNAFFGYQSGNSNTTGYGNTAQGGQALFSNSSGAGNTATGIQSLYTNTTGYGNSANGADALYYNTIGIYNTAVGTASLNKNVDGHENSAIGRNTLLNNISGQGNSAIGASALFNNTTGNSNTASGNIALHGNTTGANNTASGTEALFGNTTGSYNTAIGSRANVSSGNLTNATAIGYNAQVGASNSLVLGNGANVGIGISTPGRPLAVHSSGDIRVIRASGSISDVGLELQNTTGGGRTYTMFSSGTGSTIGVGNFNIYDEVSGLTRFSISPTGNLGIGVTAPTGQLQLANWIVNRKVVLFDVGNNDHQFYGLGINNNTLRYQTDAVSSDHVFFAGTSATSSAELVRIKGDGNVGIGTSAPSATLEVNGFTKMGSSSPAIKTLKLTATTPGVQGGGICLPLGVPASKIVSMSVLVQWNGGGASVIPNTPSLQGVGGFEYRAYFSNADACLELSASNSYNILNQPIRVFITYEQ